MFFKHKLLILSDGDSLLDNAATMKLDLSGLWQIVKALPGSGSGKDMEGRTELEALLKDISVSEDAQTAEHGT